MESNHRLPSYKGGPITTWVPQVIRDGRLRIELVAQFVPRQPRVKQKNGASGGIRTHGEISLTRRVQSSAVPPKHIVSWLAKPCGWLDASHSCRINEHIAINTRYDISAHITAIFRRQQGIAQLPLSYAELPIESLASCGDSIVYLLAEFEPLTIA